MIMSILLYLTILVTIVAREPIEHIDAILKSINQISGTIKNTTAYYDKVVHQDDIIYTRHMMVHMSALIIMTGLILMKHTRAYSDYNHIYGTNSKKLAI